MDSWSEAEWVERFRSLAAGRTVIMITHRFTTAMRADIIHVMDEGQIVESGCHDELLALGGSYAQSWRAQLRQVDGNGNGHGISKNGKPDRHRNGADDPIMLSDVRGFASLPRS